VTSNVVNLRLTTARSQLRGLRTYTAFLCAIAVVLVGLWILAGRGHGGSALAPWAIGAGIAALICLYSWVAYARAFTECTPAGLRTRGLGGLTECSWPGVSDIVLRPHGRTVTVMVTTTTGTRFRLGVPVDGGVMGDPRFRVKAQQILDYWHSATKEAAGADRPALTRAGAHPAFASRPAVIAIELRPRMFDKIMGKIWRWSFTIMIPLLCVIAIPFALQDIGPAWSAHLGHGQPGIFAAHTASCDKTCDWYGTFTGRDGSVRKGMMLADGGHVTGAGDRVAALYEGTGTTAYPAGGGTDWIYTTVLLIAGIAAAVFWAVLLFRELRRRIQRA
jgi:hypothetical protein